MSWSRLFEKCTNCKLTKNKHYAHGLCYKCYGAKRRLIPEIKIKNRVRRQKYYQLKKNDIEYKIKVKNNGLKNKFRANYKRRTYVWNLKVRFRNFLSGKSKVKEGLSYRDEEGNLIKTCIIPEHVKYGKSSEKDTTLLQIEIFKEIYKRTTPSV